MSNVIVEQKLGFLDLINESGKILFSKFKEISIITLASLLPTILLYVYILGEFSLTTIVKFSLLILLLLLQVLFSLIAFVIIAVITESFIYDKHIALAEAVRIALSKWRNALTTYLFASVIILGASLLFIVPGIIYSVYYAFALPIVALRDKGGREALDYSKTLVGRQWWRIFWTLLGVTLFFGLASAIIEILPRVFLSPLVFAIINGIITFFIAMIIDIIYVVLFLNNEFAYSNRLAKRKQMEESRKSKKSQSPSQDDEKVAHSESASSKKSEAPKATRKSAKKSTTAKNA
jgi:hypothetical protein